MWPWDQNSGGSFQTTEFKCPIFPSSTFKYSPQRGSETVYGLLLPRAYNAYVKLELRRLGVSRADM